MNALIVGVYGLYLILVGINGNAGNLAGKVQNDAPKFLPWMIAIFVLAFLHGSSETGRKVTTPFLTLLILSFVLKRFDTLQSQSKQLWDMAANAKPTATTSAGGDKVAPAGTASTTDKTGLTTSPAIGDMIHNITGSSSSNSNASNSLFALENLL